MEGKTRCPQVAGLKGKWTERLLFFLLLPTQGTPPSDGASGGGLGASGGLAAQLLAGVRIPTGAGPRLGMASVYTKYLSAKGTGGGGQQEGHPITGRSTVSWVWVLVPKTNPASLTGWVSKALLFLSPFPQPSSEQAVSRGPGQATW